MEESTTSTTTGRRRGRSDRSRNNHTMHDASGQGTDEGPKNPASEIVPERIKTPFTLISRLEVGVTGPRNFQVCVLLASTSNNRIFLKRSLDLDLNVALPYHTGFRLWFFYFLTSIVLDWREPLFDYLNTNSKPSPASPTSELHPRRPSKIHIKTTDLKGK